MENFRGQDCIAIPTGSTRRDIEERKMDGGQAGRKQIRLT